MTSRNGEVFESDPLHHVFNTNFYLQATSMKDGVPISFEIACDMLYKHWTNLSISGRMDEFASFMETNNVINYLKKNNLKIVFTGDEFYSEYQKLAC